VGYRWFARHHPSAVTFPFGFGLTFAHFQFSGFRLTRGSDNEFAAHVTVRNTSGRRGVAVPEFYEMSIDGNEVFRLVGFDRVLLAPGERKRVRVVLNRYVLGNFDDARQKWRIPSGTLEIAMGQSAENLLLKASIRTTGQLLGP
jgi:beta-glucosidase